MARQKPADHEAADPANRLLGARLQELRRMRQLSLQEVASAVGVSSSFLSMVERGKTDLSVSRFSRLSEFYNVPPSELLMQLRGDVVKPVIEALPKARHKERGAGVDYLVLQDENPEMVVVRLRPGAAFDEQLAHRGEDLWYVIDGQADLLYGSDRYTLRTGQTARFSSTIPHAIANPNSEPALLVAVSSVPFW